MNPYPLPGETIARTLRNREFGFGHYEADEPIPTHLAGPFLALVIATRVKEMTRSVWERRNDETSFEAYRESLDRWDRRYNDLLHLMHGHRYKTYLCDGFRIRLVTEPDGCRINRLAIEEIEE